MLLMGHIGGTGAAYIRCRLGESTAHMQHAGQHTLDGLLKGKLLQSLSAAAPVGVALRGQRQALAPASATCRSAPGASGRPQRAARRGGLRRRPKRMHSAAVCQKRLVVLLRPGGHQAPRLHPGEPSVIQLPRTLYYQCLPQLHTCAVWYCICREKALNRQTGQSHTHNGCSLAGL